VAAKSAARELTRDLQTAVKAKDAAKVKELLPMVMSSWKKMGNRHQVNPANAARKISRLSRSAHKAVSVA